MHALKLEAIGDHVVYERRMCRRHGVPWAPKRAIEYAVTPPWVARLVGLTERGFAREFVRGRRDYTEATGTGSRGIWVHYLLDDGLYEVNEPVAFGKARRYFLLVQGGAARELTMREAKGCLS